MASLHLTLRDSPDLGKPQLASHAWLEPVVSVWVDMITRLGANLEPGGH
jgi:hypothetical protein